ncbi:hypothetical protein B296_00007154 [Ensete ventricosum]|uniref:Asparagine synthetase domain-containing protein n=1 Tax=Ensete ventricosum TaxID=4639 RepID=A0A427B208_ENSVE|nr:hypothetical protein B296_00007154 [Ensete ventricosum]
MEAIPSGPYDPLVLREAFEKVKTQCMEKTWLTILKNRNLSFSLFEGWLAGPEGCEGPDDESPHFQDGIDAIEDVIYHTETYDVTTIRASTPMFLMSRKIKAMGVKMVISGEGSDELFGGYLYFHKAPNKEEFHRETCRKVCRLLFCAYLCGWNSHPCDRTRSVACSTALAMEWDAQWSKNVDPSGRAAVGVHSSAYDPTAPSLLDADAEHRMSEVKASGLTVSRHIASSSSDNFAHCFHQLHIC